MYNFDVRDECCWKIVEWLENHQVPIRQLHNIEQAHDLIRFVKGLPRVGRVGRLSAFEDRMIKQSWDSSPARWTGAMKLFDVYVFVRPIILQEYDIDEVNTDDRVWWRCYRWLYLNVG